MIKSIFYCKFDVHIGPIVHHQVPLHSVTPSPLSSTPPLFHFSSYASYLIPRQSYCSHSISFCTPNHRILSYPICISSPRYPRNEFLFTFAIVLPISTPATAYIPIVTKLSTLFSTLEQQSNFLSADISPPNTGPIFAICEILREDLNIYSECMIPVDDSNSLNIKLFPTYPSPPPISSHHIPLSTVRLESLTDHNWDLTMLLILPYIDGVNSVKRIAELADADYKLVRIAIAHLLYYGCITLLDVFHFGASYAVTAELGTFVPDEAIKEECRRYVSIPDTGLPRNLTDQVDHLETKGEALDGTRLMELYTSFKQGQSLRSWCLEHENLLRCIDIRRVVIFGLIKGFIYRVHKYPLSISDSRKSKKASRTEQRNPNKPRSKQRLSTADRNQSLRGEERNQEVKNHNSNFTNSEDKRNGRTESQESWVGKAHNLSQYLNGLHSFDEICTNLECSEKDLTRRLRDVKDLYVIQR